MERRLHSNEFKENAVRLAQRGDVSVSQVAKELGIHCSLLQSYSDHSIDAKAGFDSKTQA